MDIVKKYLSEKLKGLADSFPLIHIIYAYNELAETHIVQLTPQKEYYNNDALDEAWMVISLDFMNKFPGESLSFVSDDLNLIKGKPELEFFTETVLEDYQVSANNFEWFEVYNSIIDKSEDYSYQFLSEFTFNSINNEIIVSSVQDIKLKYAEQNRLSICRTPEINFSSHNVVSVKKESSPSDEFYSLSEAA